MVRSRNVVAGLFLACGLHAAAAVTFPSLPNAISVFSPNVSASNYSIETFQCAQPTISTSVNQTHITIFVTSYSQSAADVHTSGSPTGRSQFAYATFLNTTAYSAAATWDPVANNPPISSMYASATMSADKYQFDGGCDLGVAAFNASALPAQYAFVSDVTRAPVAALAAGLTTPQLAGKTLQASGCACPTYVVNTVVSVDYDYNYNSS